MALIHLAHHFHYQQTELRDFCKRINYNPAEILAKYPEFVEKAKETRLFGQAIFENLDDWADAFCKREYRNILFPLIKDELKTIFAPYYMPYGSILGGTNLEIVGHSRLGRIEQPIDDEPIVLAVYAQPKQIKSQFTRKQQEKMAVWPVEIPTHVLKYILGFGNNLQNLLFVPEKEAKHFQGFGWMSNSFQQGYGLWIGGKILSPSSYPSTFRPDDHKAINFELKIWSHSISKIMEAEKAK